MCGEKLLVSSLLQDLAARQHGEHRPDQPDIVPYQY